MNERDYGVVEDIIRYAKTHRENFLTALIIANELQSEKVDNRGMFCAGVGLYSYYGEHLPEKGITPIHSYKGHERRSVASVLRFPSYGESKIRRI